MKQPEQAIVLCGGLGTRMRPLTDTMPKPMAPVNGRPFLSYLIEQLRNEGIRQILLLTGYRGEMISEFFGNGHDYGVAIRYSHGPAEWETGRRVWEARELLDDRFLLLYSDNYVPFKLERLMAFHAVQQKTISLLLQPKSPGNIRVAEDGYVEMYDPTRKEPGLNYVEIGYMVVERDRMLPHLPIPDVSFSGVLRQLADNGQLAGMITRDPYHSISDPERWKKTEHYLADKRILLIDRDGVINQRPPRGEYVTGWENFSWIDESIDGMRQLAAQRFKFVVVSNQAGIGRGILRAEDVDEINRRMINELGRLGIEILAVYTCPHHWDDGCDCRKPAPGLFFRCAREHMVRMDRTIYIGDDPRDAAAAYNANCLSILVGPERFVDNGNPASPALATETLIESVPWIVSRFESWEAGSQGKLN